MARLQVFIVSAAIFTAVSGSHMQGGTISFKATEKTHAGWVVDFNYKSSFIDGFGGPFNWYCYTGDCGYDIQHNWGEPVENRTWYPSQWYQYEGHLKRRVDNDKPFQLWESSCCWVRNYYYEGGWQLMTSVDLGIRSDTQMPNSSPVTTIIPIIRIPQNCETTIKLLGHDPDGDLVSCRNGGYYYGECSLCAWYFSVDRSQCTLLVTPWMNTGSYPVELILEDFPKNTIYLTYNDGTIIYKHRPVNRKSRELPKDSQKYYWYDSTPSEFDTTFYEELTDSVTDVTLETTQGVEITSDIYMTEAVSEVPDVTTEPSDVTTDLPEVTTEPPDVTTDSPEVTTEPPDVITDLPEVTTEPPDVTTEPPDVTTNIPEVTTEPPDVSTEPPVTTEPPDVTSDPPDVTSDPPEVTTEPLVDIETTTNYYTTKEPLVDITSIPQDYSTEESTAERLPDIETTPHYYTEPITDLPIRTTSVFAGTAQHISTEAVTFPHETTGWDFYTTSGPPISTESLSRISLQFLVEVTNPAPSCTLGDYRPKFISPTPRQGERLLTNAGSAFQLHLSAHAVYESISDFKVSGLPGMTKSFTGRSQSTTVSMVVEWTPSENNVGDHVPICFVAETYNGYQSEMRCVTAVVGPSSLDNIELICHENTMTLIAAKSSDHELYENQFRLNDPQCLVSSNSTHLIASVAYNSCGTETEETEYDIVFKNQATSFSNESSVITRKHGVSIPFNCTFPKKSRVSAAFRAHKSDYVFTESGFGNFTYKFQFYTDDRFVEVETQYPLEVTLQELLYMKIQVNSSVPNVRLFVESCKATPHDNPSDPIFYDIIENGCIEDETLVVYSVTRTAYIFAMEAFAFIGDYSEVYVSCTVILCKFGEPGTRCTQGCITKSQGDSNRQRHRRSLTSESQQHFISQGPIRMKRQSPDNTDQGDSSSLNVNTLVISLSGVVVVALLGFIAHIYTTRARLSDYQLLKTQDF